MRLTPTQIDAIRLAAIDAFGVGSAIWLFGSRVDDSKKGGDIDLLIKPTDAPSREMLLRKARFLAALERLLGERKVDVVIESPDDERPIVRIAHETGIPL